MTENTSVCSRKNQIADQWLKENTEHKQKESPRAVSSMEGDALVIPISGLIWLPLTSCEATSFLFWYLFNTVNDNIVYWDLLYCINTLRALQEKQKTQTEHFAKTSLLEFTFSCSWKLSISSLLEEQSHFLCPAVLVWEMFPRA